MTRITKPAVREIIEDFAKEIQQKKIPTAKPSKAVINFRNERIKGDEREVCQIPIDLLRYRKDNGRISSDVQDYEKNVSILHETDDEAQEIIKEFLENKDPESTAILKKSIAHSGQLEPAIITCDGFLINGNRRKMVMEILKDEYPGDEKYKYMKVVILPGKDDPGGPPTLLEIEEIENRYQLQKEGKSEYYGFDRALSIRRKIEIGMSLEAQLKDDPQFADASISEIRKEVKEYKKDYLEPLECVDRYLKQFGREGQYRTISSGMRDRKGRWQAFLDYSNTYDRYFKNQKKRVELGIEEDEIGEIEEAAFDIIRLRVLDNLPKVHKIMRDLHKYISIEEGKKEIIKIANEVDPSLPDDECFDDDKKPLDPTEIDAKWAAISRQPIIYHTKKAHDNYEDVKREETPLTLLEVAYKKLTHEGMDIQAIKYSDLDKARKLAADVKDEANNIENEIYRQKKKQNELANKKT